MGYRYIGAKTKVLNEIIANIQLLVPEGGHVVDLMCGTAAVSAALRKKGYRVTAIDLMTFSYHHAKVVLQLSGPPNFSGANNFINKYSGNQQNSLFPISRYEQMLQALSNVPTAEGYFWREFSIEGKPNNTPKPRNYFSPENAKRIDAIRKWIKKLKKDKNITDIEHSLLLHDLIMAANDVANIAGTYGHYLSKLVGRARCPIELKPSSLNNYYDDYTHNVIRGYAEDIAGSIACDLCYIDPPYMKRQYAANYHILETLAREDEPDAIGVSGLRPWREQYSNFCTKTKIRDSFRTIFTEMKCKDFLISYSEDGLLKIDELESYFSKYGDVKIGTFKNKRFRSNDSPLASELVEYVIHLRKE